MNQLLEVPRFSDSRTAENRGEFRKHDRVPRISPNPPPEGGGMDWEPWNRGVRRGSCPENRGEPAETASLWEQRRRLEADLNQCGTLLEAAEKAVELTGRAYYAAHSRLLELTEGGRRHDYRTVLLPAYEAWRITSQAHYPHKKALREAEDWHEAILKELAKVNAEIDQPKKPRFSKKQTAENRESLLL